MKKMKFILGIVALFLVTNISAQSFNVDTENSNLKWLGKKVKGEHFGTVAIKSGSFEMEKGKIVSGEFVFDMTSMLVEDLADTKWNSKLLGHLKSDDFFSVSNHPESKLTILESSKISDNKMTVKGNLEIKGITKPIEFMVYKKGNVYTADIDVDRILYDIKYGSGKFFSNLGDNMIDDTFNVKVEIATK